MRRADVSPRPDFEALAVITSHISSTLDPNELLQKILDTTVEAVGATSGTLVLLRESSTRLKIVAARGITPEEYEGFELRIGRGITGWVAKHGEAVRVGDVSRDERYVPLLPSVKSEMAVPLMLEKEVVGVLNVDSDRLEAFSEKHLILLEAIAQQSAQVVNVSRLYMQLKRRAEIFKTLSEIAAEIGSTLRLNQLLSRIVSRSAELMGTKLCSLFLADENRETLKLEAAHGAGKSYLGRPKLEVNWSLIGQVILSREPLAIQEVRQHPWYRHVEVAKEEGLVSMLAVPLIAGENVIGVLVTYTDHAHYFGEEERELFMALAHHAAIAIENARLYELHLQSEERVRESEKLAALGQMAAGVAHEVRNPLGSIRGATQLLSREVKDHPELQEYTGVILSEVDRLNRMVEELLDFSRPRRARLQRKDLAAVIRSVARGAASSFAEEEVAFTLEVFAEPVPVLLDEEKMIQVALNLLRNAREAAGKKGEVRLEVWKDEEEGGFTVLDNGPGIPEDQMEAVFHPFVTNKPQGTGLGLSIVQRIMEEHRGRVELFNRFEAGGGLVAVVKLPLSKVSAFGGGREGADE